MKTRLLKNILSALSADVFHLFLIFENYLVQKNLNKSYKPRKIVIIKVPWKFSFYLGFNSCRTKQSLPGMALKEKEEEDEKDKVKVTKPFRS